MRVAVTEETKGVLVLEAVVVTLVAFVVEVVEFPEQAFDWDQRFFFFFFSPKQHQSISIIELDHYLVIEMTQL